MLDRKAKVVSKHAKGLEFLMRKNKVETLKGYGKLNGSAQNGIHTIELKDGVKTSQVKAKNVILATGSEARMLPGMQVDDRILSNIEILSLKEMPKSLLPCCAALAGFPGTIFPPAKVMPALSWKHAAPRCQANGLISIPLFLMPAVGRALIGRRMPLRCLSGQLTPGYTRAACPPKTLLWRLLPSPS